uniref:Uncharacterized protein n=1 Tax=Anguilla anguilla TaxID=7936 RepID=A0A0E9SKC7_ANGAN
MGFSALISGGTSTKMQLGSQTRVDHCGFIRISILFIYFLDEQTNG